MLLHIFAWLFNRWIDCIFSPLGMLLSIEPELPLIAVLASPLWQLWKQTVQANTKYSLSSTQSHPNNHCSDHKFIATTFSKADCNPAIYVHVNTLIGTWQNNSPSVERNESGQVQTCLSSSFFIFPPTTSITFCVYSWVKYHQCLREQTVGGSRPFFHLYSLLRWDYQDTCQTQNA